MSEENRKWFFEGLSRFVKFSPYCIPHMLPDYVEFMCMKSGEVSTPIQYTEENFKELVAKELKKRKYS